MRQPPGSARGQVRARAGLTGFFGTAPGGCRGPPPPPGAAPSCAEAGVLGVLPGVVGLLQAIETIKLLIGIGEPLVGTLLTYDALSVEFRRLRVRRDPNCKVCSGAFPDYVEYAEFCGG